MRLSLCRRNWAVSLFTNLKLSLILQNHSVDLELAPNKKFHGCEWNSSSSSLYLVTECIRTSFMIRRNVCFVCVCLLACKDDVTHHVVGNCWKHNDGNHAIGDEISKDLGQEVDRSTVIAARVLMTATNINREKNKLKNNVRGWKGLDSLTIWKTDFFLAIFYINVWCNS